MTDFLAQGYQSNKEMEKDGKWLFPLGTEEGAPSFKVARAGGANKAFADHQRKLLTPHKRLLAASAKEMTPEALEIVNKAVRTSFIATCMKGWKEVNGTDGKAKPFNAEAVDALFTQYPDLYDDLLGLAQSLNTYQDDDSEEDLKNL